MSARPRFKSKLHALQSAVPVWACSSCRTMHDAPKHAQCTKCHHITPPIQPREKGANQCPNCLKFKLKNVRAKPFACKTCGKTDFIYFHSTGEFHYFVQLAMLQDKGKISNLTLQKTFPVHVNGREIFKYIADFVFDDHTEGDTRWRVLDYKGHENAITGEFKLKRKLVEALFEIEIEIVR